MHAEARVDGPARRDQRLRGHLAAEDPLQVGVGLLAAEEVAVDVLEREQLDELLGGCGHLRPPPVVVGVGLGPVEPGEELLDLVADLVAGRERLVGRQQAGPLSWPRSKASYCCSRAATTSATSSLADEVAR